MPLIAEGRMENFLCRFVEVGDTYQTKKYAYVYAAGVAIALIFLLRDEMARRHPKRIVSKMAKTLRQLMRSGERRLRADLLRGKRALAA